MTTMNKTELKQAVTKIKKLLKQKDYAAIDTGVELARGLGEPAVFEALLGGWSINTAGELEYDQDFEGETLTKKWSDNSWPYFRHALISLVGYAPNGAMIDPSLVRSGIKTLDLSRLPWVLLPPYLPEFENLTSLDLSSCKALQNVDGLAQLRQLTRLNISQSYALQNLDGLANCTQLISLDLRGCSKLRVVDGLAKLTELSNLDLSLNGNLQVRPGEDGGGVKMTTREEVTAYQKGIRFFMALRDGGEDGLADYQDITSLYLFDPGTLQNARILPQCERLTSLVLSQANVTSPPDVLGNLPHLEHLSLQFCKSLQNVDGLALLTKLTSLSLWCCESLSSVADLVDLTELASLDLRKCKAVHPAPTQTQMTTREEVAAYQDLIRKSMK